MHGEDYVSLGFLFGSKCKVAYISDVSRILPTTEQCEFFQFVFLVCGHIFQTLKIITTWNSNFFQSPELGIVIFFSLLKQQTPRFHLLITLIMLHASIFVTNRF